MRTLLSFIKPVVLLLLFSVSCLPARTLVEVEKNQLGFKSGGRVTLENVNGKVIIEGWNQDEFLMEAEKRVEAEDTDKAQKIMDELEIVIDEHNDEIFIKTREPRRGSDSFLGWIFGDHVSTSVNYSIRLPRNCNLQIENTNGSIEIENVEGNILLETTNGRIETRNIGGTVEAHTTNGSINSDLNFIASEGEFQFTTTNGGIQVYVPTKASFNVRARTTNGAISTDFPLNVSGKFTGRRVEGEVNGGGPLLYLETTNGSIRLKAK